MCIPTMINKLMVGMAMKIRKIKRSRNVKVNEILETLNRTYENLTQCPLAAENYLIIYILWNKKKMIIVVWCLHPVTGRLVCVQTHKLWSEWRRSNLHKSPCGGTQQTILTLVYFDYNFENWGKFRPSGEVWSDIHTLYGFIEVFHLILHYVSPHFPCSS